MLPVVILAGGLATRLGYLTKDIPKSLLPINGKPFIHWQLELLRSQHINKVVICVGHLGGAIKGYVGNGEKWGIDVHYSEDGPNPLLTGGAIKKAIKLLGGEFFVMYGDSYLPVDLYQIAKAKLSSKKSLLLTIFNNEGFDEKPNVLYTGCNWMRYSKKINTREFTYIDYGLSLISSDVILNFSDSDRFDLSDVFEVESLKNNIEPYEVFTRYYEIGSVKGILDFENYASQNLIKE